MSEAKRYTVVECHDEEEFWAKMKEVKHGEYVLYSDYVELEKENQELIENITDIGIEKIYLEQQKAKLINLLCERCDYIGACEVEEILCAVNKYK